MMNGKQALIGIIAWKKMMTPGLSLTQAEILQGRIDHALKIMGEIHLLDDAGTHGSQCYLIHKDCLVVTLRDILLGVDVEIER
jgi:hypothetical protein